MRPTANSSYVSFNAATGPTSSLVVPNGDYIYNTMFNLTAAEAAGVGTLSRTGRRYRVCLPQQHTDPSIGRPHGTEQQLRHVL